MSKKRQAVSVLAWDYPAGHRIAQHRHAEDQLVYAQLGVMTLSTVSGTWVVPPHRAVWVPRRVEHTISMSGRVEMRTLYLRGSPLFSGCCVLAVSSLLRELIKDAVARGGLSRTRALDRARLLLLTAELKVAKIEGAHLPWPRDERAKLALERLLQAPAAQVDAVCSGLSRRTLERIVKRETGETLGRTVRQLRLLRAIELLAAGRKVTAVALDCGYDSPSAFIAAFKAGFGTTPARYFARASST
jgi:AraC-like DNA-binding protein